MWDDYVTLEVEFMPPGGEPFTIRPAPVGVTGEWPRPFRPPVHILTAWNPGPDRPGERVNRTRQETLEAELRARGVVLCPTIGRQPGSADYEEGVAVPGLTLDDALTIATQYGQDAIFQWTHDHWTTISCDGTRRHESGWRMVPVVER